MTDNGIAQPAGPGPEHKRLDIFVGKWRTGGEIRADPAGRASRLTAVDTYEWLPGGFFLLHRVDGRMGDVEVQTLEIIGYDAASGMYSTWSFDNGGNVSTYQASLREGVWSIQGESERFTGTFGDGGTTLTGHWERSTDGSTWLPWMEIRLSKDEAPQSR